MKFRHSPFLCCIGLLAFAASAGGQTGCVRPTSYSTSHIFQPCGGNNFVQSTTNFSSVYSGKTAAPPQSSGQQVLIAQGTSTQNAQTGNQSSASFNGFPAVSGSVIGLKVYYSVVTSNTACGYLWVEGKHKDGTSLQPQLTQIGSNCYNNAANCNYPLPDDTDLSTITLSFAIQAEYNNPTNPAQAVIFDVWAAYGQGT